MARRRRNAATTEAAEVEEKETKQEAVEKKVEAEAPAEEAKEAAHVTQEEAEKAPVAEVAPVAEAEPVRPREQLQREEELAMVDRALAYWSECEGIDPPLTRTNLLPHMPGSGGPGYKANRGPEHAVLVEPYGPDRFRLVQNGEVLDTYGDVKKARDRAAHLNKQNEILLGVRIYTTRGTFPYRLAMDRKAQETAAA